MRTLTFHFPRAVAVVAAAGVALTAGGLTVAAADGYTGTLTADKTCVAVGEAVTVTADVSPKPNTYRFWWGDKTRRGFSKNPTVKKTYKAPGVYEVVLDVVAGGTLHLGIDSVSVKVAATRCGAVKPTPTPTPTDPEPTDPTEPVTGAPYGRDSFFQSRVTTAPVDAVRTTEFHRIMASHPDQGGNGITWPKINMNPDWAMSYDIGQAGDPVWKLAGGNTSDPRLRILATQGFHMADSVADTFPDGDQDRPGVMVDTVYGYTVQFADAVPNRTTRTITVSNAGIMWHSSNGLDYRNPASDDNRNFTSRGRILDAMVIRRDLLDRAVANNTGLGHVLHLYFVETNTADGFAHPMVGAESGKSGFGAEGERLRIKPSINLEARGLTGAALAIARTLQEHGTYLGDNSGSSTQIKAAQSQFYTGTNLATDVFKGKITWQDFEVVATGFQ